MKKTKILVLEGDGIGPEVTSCAVEILNLLNQKFELGIEIERDYIGGVCIDKFGVPIRKETIEKAVKYGIVLLGAVGGPKWEKNQVRPEQGLLELRKKMGVFANIRPIFDLPVKSNKTNTQFNILFVRELTGGIYFGKKKIYQSAKGKVAIDVLKYTDQEIRRVVKIAFEFARQRKKFLVSVDKANVLASSKLWREVVNEVSKEYEDVKVEHHLVDSFAMNLILKPWYFDVVVTENLFGDILTDEAAVLVGSIGLLPSASISSRRALYEPIHGSAPDIAGQNKANPVGAILSLGLMFKYSLNNDHIYDLIYRAVIKTLSRGYFTFDLSPNNYLSTWEFTQRVISNLET
ncbi:MAG: 3-isopropylmalate dehydrogenase [bacterium]